MGDADLRLQVLLPVAPAFDMAVNIFTYQPGATLPQVEIHVMEHGLLMLDGAGVYRLGDDYHPVQAGDVIWMASVLPAVVRGDGQAAGPIPVLQGHPSRPAEAKDDDTIWPTSTSSATALGGAGTSWPDSPTRRAPAVTRVMLSDADLAARLG